MSDAFDALEVRPIERCDSCGRWTTDYEVRTRSQDPETGYSDEQVLCHQCAGIKRGGQCSQCGFPVGGRYEIRATPDGAEWWCARCIDQEREALERAEDERLMQPWPEEGS